MGGNDDTNHQQRQRPVSFVVVVLTVSVAALGFALHALYQQQQVRCQQQPFHVIIIGGGISGLAAAYTLLSSDNQHQRDAFAVTLLEAKDRLGGRLYTIPMASSPSSPIDLGGMYWHGSDSEAMQFLQSLSPTVPSGGKSNLPGHGSSEWKLYTKSDNEGDQDSGQDKGTWKTLSASELERAQELYMQWDANIKQQYATFMAHESSKCDAQAPSGEAESCSAATLADTDNLLSLWSNSFLDTLPINDRHLVEFIKTMSFQLDRGVGLEELSLQGVGDDWGWRDIGGTDHVAKFGMSRVVDALAGLTDMTVRLGERVRRIDYRQPGRCSVTSESNRSYTANACVVTLPIGVLKANSQAIFRPPLPVAKQEVLERAGVAVYNTLAVHWRVPVCGSTSTAYYLVGNPAVNNPLRFGFVCSSQLRDPADPNSITQFYISGKEHPFDDVGFWKEKAVEVVRVIRKDVQLSDIVDTKISSWHTDVDMLGSYSASTWMTRGDADRRILAESLDRTIYFAGEHTHYAGRYQSIDGAFETGRRAANEVGGGRVGSRA